jgi:hypothetical protein
MLLRRRKTPQTATAVRAAKRFTNKSASYTLKSKDCLFSFALLRQFTLETKLPSPDELAIPLRPNKRTKVWDFKFTSQTLSRLNPGDLPCHDSRNRCKTNLQRCSTDTRGNSINSKPNAHTSCSRGDARGRVRRIAGRVRCRSYRSLPTAAPRRLDGSTERRKRHVISDERVGPIAPTLDGGYVGIAHNIAGAFTAQGISAADAVLRAQGVLYGMVQKSAAMLAADDTFWILALVFLSMIPLVVFLKKTGPHKGAVMME